MRTASQLKILAIDDEQLLLYALCRACKDRPLDITAAATPQEALNEIGDCHFDLFLLDFDHKDPNCLELLRTIDERRPYVPIIFMTTGDRRSSELNEVIKSTRKRGGVWNLLEKPFSLDRIIHCIENSFRDEVNVKLHPVSSNDDHDKRGHYRRAHVEPVSFSYKKIVDGATRQTSSHGILTDISEAGAGILSHEQHLAGQMLCFENGTTRKYGVVAWNTMLEQGTFRFGVQFC